MKYPLTAQVQKRLEGFLELLDTQLTDKRQWGSLATYLLGLLSPLERKSLEPLAAQVCPCPYHGSAAHQQLQQFSTDSPWRDEPIRTTAVRYALEPMLRHGPVEVSIFDDTSHLKKGTHSVGVARQYASCVGKVANCQVTPSLVLATPYAHLPVDIQLYLPHSWLDDPERTKEARIPDDIQFRTKPQLALEMVDSAQRRNLPLGVVTADAGYGNSQDFRLGLRARHLHYLVGVQGSTSVQLCRRKGSLAPFRSIEQIAQAVPAQDFTEYFLPGCPKPRRVLVAFRQVVVPGDWHNERQWLLIEWRPEEKPPLRYYLCSLPPSTRKRRLVQLLKLRWSTEQAYAEMKGELGMSHYEGRKWPGLNHHMSVVIAAYAFVTAEKERSFSPWRDSELDAGALLGAPGASRPRLLRHLAAVDRTGGAAHPSAAGAAA
jgi:SRSO17 transposase